MEVGAAAAADTFDGCATVAWLRLSRAAWAPGITSAWRCAAVRPGDSPCGRRRETPTDPFWSLRYRKVRPITLEVIVLNFKETLYTALLWKSRKERWTQARWWLEPVEWTLAGAEHLRIFSSVRWLLFWCAILTDPYMVKVEREREAEGSYHSQRFIVINSGGNRGKSWRGKPV